MQNFIYGIVDKKMELEQAIKNLKKEQEWIREESRYIQNLKYAIKVKDYEQVKRFERKARRSETRTRQFQERIFKIINFLRQSFPSRDRALFEVEKEIKRYVENILKRISYVDGTIPELLREKLFPDLDKISNEIDLVMEEGVIPLVNLLARLENEMNNLKALETQEQRREKEALELQLRKQPFLILFHSANEKAYVNSILGKRAKLPEYYMGRKLEYAFEVDYFWIEHHGKISPFLGHAPHGMTPRNAKRILAMRRGEASPENILKRKGLLLPKWIFSRIGIIKLVIEIKSGWGSDTRALDELVKLVKSYHLENNIRFYAYSHWVLSYLKQRLPKAFTILICFLPFSSGPVIHFPLNRPLKLLLSFWRIPIFSFSKKFNSIDAFAVPARKSEGGIIRQISKSTNSNKYHFAGMIKTKEQFDWLIKHGARGGMLWVPLNEIMKWIEEAS